MKVLVVVDVQNDFVDPEFGALGTKEAMAIIPKVVNKIKAYKALGKGNYIIIATQDTHGHDYLETQEGKNLPVPHTIFGTWGWEINDEVFKALDEEVDENVYLITKPTFGLPTLAYDITMIIQNSLGRARSLILDSDVELEIELIGLDTDVCVISNALPLKASFPEVLVGVDASCCAGVTPATHEAALTVMKMCQVNITNWEVHNDSYR